MYERTTEASSVSLPIQAQRQYQFLFTATALFSPTHTLKFLQNAQRKRKKKKRHWVHFTRKVISRYCIWNKTCLYFYFVCSIYCSEAEMTGEQKDKVGCSGTPPCRTAGRRQAQRLTASEGLSSLFGCFFILIVKLNFGSVSISALWNTDVILDYCKTTLGRNRPKNQGYKPCSHSVTAKSTKINY